MRGPPYNRNAPKNTVSVTLNSDLYAKSKEFGINTSKVAEEALARAYSEKRAAALTAELQQDLAAAEKYSETHGSFGDFVRSHYETDDGAV